jgi:hypothetical protein
MPCPTIDFVFDELVSEQFIRNNMTLCADRRPGNDFTDSWPRFSQTSLYHVLQQCTNVKVREVAMCNKPQKYVYATSAFGGCPAEWAGWPGNEFGFHSLFEYIPQPVLHDMQQGRAVLLLDTCMEGWAEDRLYDFLHGEMSQRQLPDHAVMYVNSNLNERLRYEDWCTRKGIAPRLHAMGYDYFELTSRSFFKNCPTPSWEDHMKFPNKLLYACLNRVNRYHRNVMILRLSQLDLMGDGLISCEGLHYRDKLLGNRVASEAEVDHCAAQLPRTIDFTDFRTNPAMEINADIFLRTRFSIVTETMCDDAVPDFFISEKIYKNIYMLQPFMILGQRGLLQHLRSQGYETFHGFWSEAYDGLTDLHDRAAAIAAACQLLKSKTDDQMFWDQLRDVCEHNQQLYMGRGYDSPFTDWLTHQLARFSDG